MAHQAHGIKWGVLADNLMYRKGNMYADDPSDIVFSFKPGQGKAIDYFVQSFDRNLQAHTVTERRKYPETYDAPNPDDVLVDDAAALKVQHTVYRWRAADRRSKNSKVTASKGLCSHKDGPIQLRSSEDGEEESDYSCIWNTPCSCSLPFTERKASAFSRKYVYNDCYRFLVKNGEAFMNMDLVKTLIVYGEMDPVLRACAIPEVDFAEWKFMRDCNCCPAELGWDMIYMKALDAYIALNIIYNFPALWDPASGCQRQGPLDAPAEGKMEEEYRNTALYQKMITNCNTTPMSPIATYPHQQFFGIPEDHLGDAYCEFTVTPRRAMEWPVFHKFIHSKEKKWTPSGVELPCYEMPYGQIPYNVFMDCHKPLQHVASPQDISEVYDILGSQGLPPELALDIVKLAGYDTVKRRLSEPHDPFHPHNQSALLKYLNFCWLTIVRCNMFAKELGMVIDWRYEVLKSLERLVGVPPGKTLWECEYPSVRDEQGVRRDQQIFHFLDASGTRSHTVATSRE